MPKCRICGKKFGSLSALRDHNDSVHRSTRFVAPKTTYTKNFFVIIIIVIIISSSLIGYVIYVQIHSAPQPPSCTSSQTTSLNLSLSRKNPSVKLLAQDQSLSQIGQPISSSLSQELVSVSNSTLSTVGLPSGVNSPTKICGDRLLSNGKPLVFYVGGEYCPFCAAERWSMVVALSKFGTFSNLTYMMSWASEQNPANQNISTLSFNYASYSSNYISFVGIEEFDRSNQVLHTLTSSQKALVNEYDSIGSIPFVDIANNYSVVGAQYSPSTLSGLSWDQIGAQLDNPTSTVGKSVDGAANTLITAICNIDGGLPTNVCGQSYATLTLSNGTTSSASGIFQLETLVNVRDSEQGFVLDKLQI